MIYGYKRIVDQKLYIFLQESKVPLGLIICIRDGFCHYQLYDGGACHGLQWVPLLYTHVAFCCDCTVREHFLRRLDFLNAYRQGVGGAAS